MSPDEDNPTSASALPDPQRANEPASSSASSQQAAADLLRTKIGTLYDSPSDVTDATPEPAPSQLEYVNPYDRTHSNHPQPQPDQWKQYHSAWQTYYQKYYEGYYTHHLKNAKQSLQTQSSAAAQQGYFTHRADEPESSTDTITRDEALFDLRQKLLVKVQSSAKKARKSRHFVPIASALVVILVFVFLQYNRAFIASVTAYVTPGNIDPQNIVIDPTTDIDVGPQPRLIIPKINVDVPVIYDIGNDFNSQQTAMKSGVANFAIPGASSRPGQIGNTVISGHSSNDILDPGDYKFIFAQLEKLAIGDSIYANYNSKRYTYTITNKEVVKPSEINKLVYETPKPVMTLITCTPLGTALNRLLVTAEQVSPDPIASTAAPTIDESSQSKAIPGNSPTFFERIFGG
ncbi:sortase [Candidatus Saccharibacteria bacterium]|nr:sortase [Candidatus Saccharibacteria bacterium]